MLFFLKNSCFFTKKTFDAPPPLLRTMPPPLVVGRLDDHEAAELWRLPIHSVDSLFYMTVQHISTYDMVL